MIIHIYSPYKKQYAYPSFWHLLDRLEENSNTIFNPIEKKNSKLLDFLYKTKLKHLLPILSLLVYPTKGRPDVIVTFGVYQIIFIKVLKLVYKNAIFITYQPELFEFNSTVLTGIFRKYISLYDIFIDVDSMRLKLRRRYFKNIRQAFLLPNFNHELKIRSNTNKRYGYFLYAGVLDTEASLVQFCSRYSIPLGHLDVYITNLLDEKPLGIFKLNNPRPFDQIAIKGYSYGIICYPFMNGDRKSLNNKYCAPSKFFSYLSNGIKPIHYKHPTLNRFSRMSLSIDTPQDFYVPFLNEDNIAEIFSEMGSLVQETVSNLQKLIDKNSIQLTDTR